MDDINALAHMENKGGRRSGHDRREFSASRCIPEKRTGRDRRTGREDFVNIIELEMNTDESLGFLRSVRGLFEAICICLLLWGLIIISIDFIFARIISTFVGGLQ